MWVKYLFLFLFCLFTYACQEGESGNASSQRTDTLPKALLLPRTNNYYSAKINLQNLRNVVRKQLQKGKIDSTRAAELFTEGLLQEIIPHWYGTAWDFNGYTDTPQKGKIACGYFVSTTLLHAGINLDRYKLAQQSPIIEAKALSLNQSIRSFQGFPAGLVSKKINKELKEGLYFIGLGGTHVGYLLKREDKLYLIHANYVDSAVVTIQPLMKSVFKYFVKWHVADITHNRTLLRYWLSGEKCELSYPDLE